MARASNFLAIFKGDPKVQNQVSKLVEEYCKIERETRLSVGILTEELSADNIIDRGWQYFPEGDILESLKMYLLKDGYSGPLDFPAWEFRDLRRVAINGIEYSPVVHPLCRSFVLFRDSSCPEVAVQIQQIFTMKVIQADRVICPFVKTKVFIGHQQTAAHSRPLRIVLPNNYLELSFHVTGKG
ncbi:hypothetical protein IW261DRAFT_1422815 [Armillaria novae-zelandiae]|uniref:Uncharacterized protein n=1 Tax=Armillaria novae-zelandiae TaxID=153914 RepID=A0AA39TZT9_9AGAR|nr:hypothetical protein IW261DRAFT_1422815 [Armillaria novae-zelandiae]